MTAPRSQSTQNLLTAFIHALGELETSVSQSNIDGRSLQQQFLAAQQLYQQQLRPTLMTSPDAEEWVTYQTEINRTFRLLGIDVSFLQTAKNALTVQKRQAQMQQHLQALLKFCHELEQQLTQ